MPYPLMTRCPVPGLTHQALVQCRPRNPIHLAAFTSTSIQPAEQVDHNLSACNLELQLPVLCLDRSHSRERFVLLNVASFPTHIAFWTNRRQFIGLLKQMLGSGPSFNAPLLFADLTWHWSLMIANQWLSGDKPLMNYVCFWKGRERFVKSLSGGW